METVSICNIICYEKWKIFGKTCRIFGVTHYSTDEEYVENSQPDSLNLIDYIEDKLNENKKIPGIIDIYSENNFSINEDLKPENYIGTIFDDVKYDAIVSMHNKFMGCFYEDHRSEDYPLNCIYSHKYGDDINARFHFIDIRKKIYGIGKVYIIDPYEEYFEEEGFEIFKIIFEKFKIYLLACISGEEIADLSSGLEGYEDEFVKTNFILDERNSKIENGVRKHRIYFQFKKLKQSTTGLSLFEKILEFIQYKIKSFSDLKANFEQASGFVDCALLDLYFYGRFFNNIINNLEPTESSIIVVGDYHRESYDEIFTYLGKYFPIINEGKYFEEKEDDNCIHNIPEEVIETRSRRSRF